MFILYNDNKIIDGEKSIHLAVRKLDLESVSLDRKSSNSDSLIIELEILQEYKLTKNVHL